MRDAKPPLFESPDWTDAESEDTGYCRAGAFLDSIDVICTRCPGHAAPHVAGDGDRIVAYWED